MVYEVMQKLDSLERHSTIGEREVLKQVREALIDELELDIDE